MYFRLPTRHYEPVGQFPGEGIASALVIALIGVSAYFLLRGK